MASPEPPSSSFATTSRTHLRPLGVTIDDSSVTETNNTQQQEQQERKLSQKRKTLSFCQSSIGGHLSPWPTYTSGQTILHNRKPCSDIHWKRTGSWQRQSLGITKPRYLEQLENYLRKELLLLDLSTDSAQELRLQPYREIFEFFIEDFKTYKPLLSSIKNAYEVMLAHQREKIRALEPLKAKLVTVNEECNERILAMRAEERSEISLLKKEKMNLLKLIDKKNEEKISLQSEVAKLRKNLAEEYLRYLSERDARKILIADLNELRYQREDMSLAQSPGIWGEDPVKLTLALKMARQDLARTQMELNTMKANFGDVVPRRDFEMQEKTNKDLQEQLDSLRDDYEEVRKEHEILLQLHMSTVKERDQFCSELQEIQRTSTPRPDWTKCESVVAGGSDRWHMLAEGKNSDQLVDVLLEEIGEMLLREKDFFPGLGYAESIPTFLRFDGLVENKKPTKKDVVNLLKDAWKERLAEEQKEKFSDFFFSFLERRFGPADAMAWAYTIFENIKLFHSNEIMTQFYTILMEKMSESVYVKHKETVSQLLKEMTNADSQNEGLLTMEQFSYEEVTLPKVREALTSIDSSLDKQTLNSYLSQAFQFPLTELPEESEEKEEEIVMKLQTVLVRLQMIDIRRRGPREQEPTS
ncbi:translin-associated factor X-interacting protein 1 isoform X2 [Desmodus rotundus]|uniref:translin-associated factor X-interacting protein 1 isoform X2 n=1 Tax=Desmodus rotundus TaxID=9430 RepID=UPI0023817C47|nr:translin-associated factor X-interacting protein 1 isoform X2 [Desmodus rotundus]